MMVGKLVHLLWTFKWCVVILTNFVSVSANHFSPCCVGLLYLYAFWSVISLQNPTEGTKSRELGGAKLWEGLETCHRVQPKQAASTLEPIINAHAAVSTYSRCAALMASIQNQMVEF